MPKNSLQKVLAIGKTFGVLLGSLAALSLLLLQAYAVALVSLRGEPRLPPTFGNSDRVRALLADEGKRDEFSFGVIGDTRGSETGEQIIKGLAKEPLAFVVLLGDCVPSASESRHRFFRMEWEESPTRFPVFYVVGNHDVVPEAFPVNRFEELYGPTNFFFRYRGCLFIFLRVLDRPIGERTTEESLEFFESVLAAQRRNDERVFVFTHIPPAVSPHLLWRSYRGSDRFVRLCDQYRVDYVISGDFHGYARVKLRNTTYLLSGGGGSPLRAPTFGRFHHGIVLRVGPASVSEDILVVGTKSDLLDGLERLAVGRVRKGVVQAWYVAVPLDLAALAVCIFGIRALVRSVRKWTRGLRPPGAPTAPRSVVVRGERTHQGFGGGPRAQRTSGSSRSNAR